VKLDWAAVAAARKRWLARDLTHREAREQWLDAVRGVAAALVRGGYGTGRVIETGGIWPERFTVTPPSGETVTVHVTPGPGDVQNLAAREIRDCRVRAAEDLLARFCKAGQPVPQVVADWAGSHGVALSDCPACRDARLGQPWTSKSWAG
jgi:hypothetical protein